MSIAAFGLGIPALGGPVSIFQQIESVELMEQIEVELVDPIEVELEEPIVVELVDPIEVEVC